MTSHLLLAMLLGTALNLTNLTGWHGSKKNLRGTNHLGLQYSIGEESGVLIGYSDADWGGDCNDYKSTSGYLFQIGGTAVT